MKRLISLIAGILILAANVSSAQSSKEIMKERKELHKASKKELNEKASRMLARKQKNYLRKAGKQLLVLYP